jgi:hypothetical protein
MRLELSKVHFIKSSEMNARDIVRYDNVVYVHECIVYS